VNKKNEVWLIWNAIFFFIVDGRIILRCIFRKRDVRVWSESSRFRIGTGGRHL
jgi:hypothetical protein